METIPSQKEGIVNPAMAVILVNTSDTLPLDIAMKHPRGMERPAPTNTDNEVNSIVGHALI